jgi:lysyl-tRNA synthetase class 1
VSGWVSPFGGAAKLPWNLEWAAQWSLFGVTIEPCGKDLATAGGSRDRSDAIAREVFEREPPINVPYEFLNVGGRKMSTSKGRGTAAHRIVEVLPPEPLRTLMIRSRPNTAIDFDPEGTDAVPRLFDEFDRLGAAVAGREVKGELPAGFDSIFRYALRDPAADFEAEAAAFRPSFSHLAFLLQVPGADIPALMAAEKGSALTPHETAILDERLAAARVWLDDYAPERARMRVHEALPDAAAALDPEQRAFLSTLAEDDAARTGDEWQAAIFATAASGGLPAGRAFAALYAAFLGRTSGPRAGWLLASLDRAFVLARLREAAAGGTLPA